MGRPAKGQHVLGPYRSGKRWQVILVEPRGAEGESARTSRFFATEALAIQYRDLIVADVIRDATTIHEALDRYEEYLTEKGNKPQSIGLTLHRLKIIIPEADRDLALADLGDAHGRSWYRAMVDAGYAVDTHRNYLAEARSFFAWCVEQRWARSNPLAGVKGVGRRRHGKPQLRIDEARRWMAQACALALGSAAVDRAAYPTAELYEKACVKADDAAQGAVAALMTLLLGIRAKEVVTRLVRDVDDEGRLLWVTDTKTPAGRRTLEVPDALREYLRALVKGRDGAELLFKGRSGKGRGRAAHRDRKWPTTWVAQIAELAGVPRVTSHGMRGLHSSLAIDAGMSGHLVAASLGHESFTTTTQSYAKPGVTEGAAARKSLKVLAGGKTRK